MDDMLTQLARQLGISDSALARAAGFVRLSEFEGLRSKALALGRELETEIDFAPVLESSSSFLAKFEHASSKIILNGHYLKSSPQPARAREFLRMHEIFHALCLKKLASPLAGADEETSADIFAMACLIAEGGDQERFHQERFQ